MALSTILLCGAVPFDPPVYEPVRTVVYCRCPVMQPVRPPPPPLPDVVPRFNCKQQQQHEIKQQQQIVTASLVPVDRLSTPHHQDEEDFSKNSNTLAWKQVGRDLRIIADAFSASDRCHISQHQRRRMTISTSADWIWNALLQSAVVYVAWRIHRWTSS